MGHRTIIIKKIEQAMKSACRQTELFTDAIAEPIAAEYLFTVEVAKAIAEHNGPPGDPYVIRVERDAGTFAMDCLKPIARNKNRKFGERMILRRSRPNIGREGRIDVTVYTEKFNSGYGGHQPLCAIEVKGFNPAKDLVLEDLRRNLSFLKTSGDTGESVLEFAVFAAFYSYKRTKLKQAINRENILNRQYESYLKEVDEMTGISAEVIILRISLEQHGEVIPGIEYDEIDLSKKHHIAGAIVVMSRAQTTTSSS
ncbi:hypothetical protein R1H25_05665 [Stenotrophomonas sp. C2852]|uniref:hypothetical protein n=1 Tax=Stenotrophomonas sp. C2852 TaxID=3077845 RepID=UPI00293CD2AB|nr:hypothetical protein [Stenotrophomonas sp. C2852]MDV3434936.1 hypothetical protein [Stenotrophomonas sp. C2852]